MRHYIADLWTPARRGPDGSNTLRFFNTTAASENAVAQPGQLSYNYRNTRAFSTGYVAAQTGGIVTMKKHYVIAFLVIAVISLALLIAKFPSITTPPSVNTVQQCFDENRQDILLVVSFMKDLGFEDVYITDASKKALADFTTIKISDNEVGDAIQRLLGSNTYVQISKMDETISFLQWAGSSDIGCGIVYSQDIDESIDREFITELAPLSDECWFYYVSDYNAWRTGKRALLESK